MNKIIKHSIILSIICGIAGFIYGIFLFKGDINSAILTSSSAAFFGLLISILSP